VSVPEPRAALPQLLGRAKGVARVDRRGRFAVRGLTVACPADGVCTVAVRAGGRVPARGTATVAAGRSTVVAGRIGAAALKRLKPGRATTVRLQVTVTGPGGTVAKTVAVKLRRR
jgi:hypothetical protein